MLYQPQNKIYYVILYLEAIAMFHLMFLLLKSSILCCDSSVGNGKHHVLAWKTTNTGSYRWSWDGCEMAPIGEMLMWSLNIFSVAMVLIFATLMTSNFILFLNLVSLRSVANQEMFQSGVKKIKPLMTDRSLEAPWSLLNSTFRQDQIFFLFTNL